MPNVVACSAIRIVVLVVIVLVVIALAVLLNALVELGNPRLSNLISAKLFVVDEGSRGRLAEGIGGLPV